MDSCTIGQAGLRLTRSYNQILRLIMLAQLKGWQEPDGSWLVSLADLDRFERETMVGGPAPASSPSNA